MIEKIKKLLTSNDYKSIDQGIDLVRKINDKNIFSALLKDCRYDPGNFIEVHNPSFRGVATQSQPIVTNDIFAHTSTNREYMNYAILNLVGFAPDNLDIDKSIQKKYIKELCIYSSEKFPIGILEIKKLKEFIIYTNKNSIPIPDEIDKLSELEVLNWECKIKDIPSSIKNLKKLKKLHLSNNRLESIPDFIYEMKSLEEFSVDNNRLKRFSKNISLMKNLNDINIHLNPFIEKHLVESVDNGYDYLMDPFLREKTDFIYIMGNTLHNWMFKYFSNNSAFYFIDVPAEPVDPYDGDSVIYDSLNEVLKDTTTPSYILRAISMFFIHKENIGKILIENKNCPLGVLFDIIKCNDEELKYRIIKSPVMKKIKPIGFGRYGHPITAEPIAKIQDGKLVAVERSE